MRNIRPCFPYISAVHQPFMFQFEFQHNVYWIIKIKNYLLLLYMPAGGGGATTPSLGKNLQFVREIREKTLFIDLARLINKFFYIYRPKINAVACQLLRLFAVEND